MYMNMLNDTLDPFITQKLEQDPLHYSIEIRKLFAYHVRGYLWVEYRVFWHIVYTFCSYFLASVKFKVHAKCTASLQVQLLLKIASAGITAEIIRNIRKACTSLLIKKILPWYKLP